LGVIDVSSYRFCRTDDIGLLVDALNRCWLPHFPDEEPMTSPAFKRWIRDLQVWCSSCMVAFSGKDPIGVLIGAKRPSGTLVHRIAVHPDHQRQGHGRHLLASLGSKLSILGPPRIVAEVPESLPPALELFRASGYVEEAVLTDFALCFDAVPARPGAVEDAGGAPGSGLMIPVTVDDLVANGLLGAADPAYSYLCWERSIETLTARKDEIAGIAIASDEQIEAYVLYLKHETETEVLSFRCLIEDGGASLRRIIDHFRARGMATLRLTKVHPREIPRQWLDALRFSPTGSHRVYAATAGSA
jgi:GNAT superfamily N-acetyltransferase